MTTGIPEGSDCTHTGQGKASYADTHTAQPARTTCLLFYVNVSFTLVQCCLLLFFFFLPGSCAKNEISDKEDALTQN